MDFLANVAAGFIGLFNAGGATFMGLVTGILPTLIVLITFVNSIIMIIGEDKVEGFAKKMTGNIITRYTVFPFLAMFFLTNPMAYTFGKFLEEKYKPAFYDSAVSFAHPILGLFPHANAGELFVWLGISSGITTLGLPISGLAVRYLLAGLVVILIRGIVTEKITFIMMGRKGVN
ncbi:MAG: PTS sorbitol transporter subunit IIC [Eubacteriaceae bacterium]|nr:PTS sorbitol transporter subunit IIC [Eubacteriaceae bacterium]